MQSVIDRLPSGPWTWNSVTTLGYVYYSTDPNPPLPNNSAEDCRFTHAWPGAWHLAGTGVIALGVEHCRFSLEFGKLDLPPVSSRWFAAPYPATAEGSNALLWHLSGVLAGGAEVTALGWESMACDGRLVCPNVSQFPTRDPWSKPPADCSVYQLDGRTEFEAFGVGDRSLAKMFDCSHRGLPDEDKVTVPSGRMARVATADKPLKPAEVAVLMRVDPKTVVRWASAGLLPGFQTPGRRWRFRRSVIEAILDEPADCPVGDDL